MTAFPLLRQLNEERASLLAGALPRIGGLASGRRRLFSGVRWRSDLLVTAAESIAGAERVAVQLESGEASAEVLAADLATDVAVLRVPATGPLPAQSPPATVRVGDAIAVLGRGPRGPAAIWGHVRLVGAAWRSRRGGEIAQRLEFDVRFDPVLEGAAVIDMQGTIIAMAVPGPFRRVIGIPAATIERIVAKVEHHGHLPQPYLGVRLQPLWLDEATRTKLKHSSHAIAVVAGIDADSPAAVANLALGDLLLRVNGQPVESAEALAQQIASAGPGQTIALEVLRGGQPIVVDIKVGERLRG
jgi:S1-C subfamily serine protease